MTNRARMSVPGGRSAGKLIAGGVASIDLNQHMTLARKRCTAGSVAGDWRTVASDLRRCVNTVRREFETA